MLTEGYVNEPDTLFMRVGGLLGGFSLLKTKGEHNWISRYSHLQPSRDQGGLELKFGMP